SDGAKLCPAPSDSNTMQMLFLANRGVRIVFVIVLFQAWAGDVWAQTTENSGVHLGLVVVSPTINLVSATDSNIFNNPENPQQDVVTTLTSKALTTLQVGSVFVTSTTVAPYNYFARFASQGGWGVDQSARASVLLGGLTPYLEGSYQNL